jgi:hypothetical protein
MAAAGSRQVRELSLRSAGGAEQATHLLAARALGCHVASARRQLADEGSCGAGQIWCWMSCQSIAQLDCDKTSAQCRNPTDVQSPPRLWPQDYLVRDLSPPSSHPSSRSAVYPRVQTRLFSSCAMFFDSPCCEFHIHGICFEISTTA